VNNLSSTETLRSDVVVSTAVVSLLCVLDVFSGLWSISMAAVSSCGTSSFNFSFFSFFFFFSFFSSCMVVASVLSSAIRASFFSFFSFFAFFSFFSCSTSCGSLSTGWIS
jgi:hypothetical protein